MSIAELIMTGTKRSSESTAWVGDSLQKLGQQVGQALAQKEQQKQAQEMLPFLQQSMQDSMTMAQSGDTAGAYSNIMGMFASNPNLINNKSILPFLDLGLKGVQAAGQTWEDKERVRAYGERYGTQEGQPAQVDVASQLAALNEEPLPDATLPVEEMEGLPAMEPSPTPEEQPAAVGPTNEAAAKLSEPPSEKNIETFIKKEDAFAKLPVDKQKIEMDTASIIFPDKEELDKYTPEKGRAVMPLSNSVRVGVPGAIAVELPEEYTKYVQGNVNINEKTQTVTYSLTKEKINPDAADAIKWLRDWQTASLQVAANPNLSKLLSQADNDALNIDIVPTAGKGVDGTIASRVLSNQAPQNQFDLSIKGNPSSKITVTKDEADRIELLQTQTAAANIHNAKFIRLKTTPAPKATPAPKTSGQRKSLSDMFGNK